MCMMRSLDLVSYGLENSIFLYKIYHFTFAMTLLSEFFIQ